MWLKSRTTENLRDKIEKMLENIFTWPMNIGVQLTQLGNKEFNFHVILYHLEHISHIILFWMLKRIQ